MIESAKQISKESKSSFYYAFNLLPEKQRDAMNTVYAFCRKTDDIVDDLARQWQDRIKASLAKLPVVRAQPETAGCSVQLKGK